MYRLNWVKNQVVGKELFSHVIHSSFLIFIYMHAGWELHFVLKFYYSTYENWGFS